MLNNKALIKLAVSAIMLVIVLRTVDFSRLQSTILNMSLGCAMLVLFGYLLGQILSSYKWWLIARAAGVTGSWPRALRCYFIGMFINNFGFGTLAGDAARGILLAFGTDAKAQALSSVVADRLQGLAVISLIGSAAVVIFGAQLMDWRLLLLLALIGPGIVAGWFIVLPLLEKWLPDTYSVTRLARDLLKGFPKDRSTITAITLISFFFHLLQISLHWVMAKGIGVDIPLDLLFVTIPFVNIVSTLPISWNGLGVRENAYVFFLAPLVLSSEQAIAFGAIWFCAVILTSAAGGLVAVATNDLAKLRAG